MSDAVNTDTTEAVAQANPNLGKTDVGVAAIINALHDNAPNYMNFEKKFTFREIEDEATKEKTRRAPVTLEVPVPTYNGLLAALEDEKQQAYILDLLRDAIVEAAKEQINDAKAPVNTQEALDISKLTLAYLANEPKAVRAGRGISKETWEEFNKDYLAIMPAALNKTEDKVKAQLDLLDSRLQKVKLNKPVLKQLQQYIAVYATTSQRLDDVGDVVLFLDKKCDEFLALTDEALLDAI